MITRLFDDGIAWEWETLVNQNRIHRIAYAVRNTRRKHVFLEFEQQSQTAGLSMKGI